MTRVPPKVRPHDDEPPLPPLDDDGEASDDLGVEYDFGEEDASLDDAVADDLDSDFELEDGPDAGLDAADEADDADVGDLAEGIDTGEGTWVGDDAEGEAEHESGIDEMPSLADDDDVDGTDDLGHDVIDESRFDPLAEDVDEGSADDVLADTIEPERTALPGFALPKPGGATVARIECDGLILAAAVQGDRIVLVGDGVFSLSTNALDSRTPRPRKARRLGSGADVWIASVVSVDEGTLVAATVAGDVLRSEDGGATWVGVAALGGEDVGKAAVELIAEPGAPHRLWARAHGGGWFRSDDGGRRWEGPVLPQPVRAAAPVERGEGVLVATSGWAPQLLKCADGHRWDAFATKLPGTPTAMACSGDAWAIAFGRNAGVVTLDAGKTMTSWPLLAGASALTWCSADDGALQLLVAVHDEAGDRATLFRAATDATGAARSAHRIVDLDGVFERGFDTPGEDGDERVEQLVRLDPAGNRVLVVTPRGVAVVFGE